MSTRGAVAFGTEQAWQGVYNHSDSQPPLLGSQVWRVAQSARSTNGLESLRAAIIQAGTFPAFLSGTVAPERLELSNSTAHPLHIEYVYVIDPDSSLLVVLTGDPCGPPIDGGLRFDPDGEWQFVRVDSYPLTSEEPDWRACGLEWRRANCDRRLQPIRARFGGEAFEAAKRQWLDEQ